MADLGIIHTALILQKKLWDQEGFHPHFRRLVRPGSVPLQWQCIELSEWTQNHSGDPRKRQRCRIFAKGATGSEQSYPKKEIMNVAT